MNSVLENIKKEVDNINWKNQTYRFKAINLCISIYNLYVYDGGDFNHYKSLSKEYFKKVIKSSLSYVYEIKNTLIENGILEPHISGSYSVEKGKGKSYRFNQKLINGDYVVLCGTKQNKVEDNVVLCGTKNLFSNLNYSFSNLHNLELYHICGTKLETYINKGLQSIRIKPEINDWISNFILKREDIKVNDEIKNDYVNLKLENDEWRVSIEKAKEMTNDNDLILYKEKCYIEKLENFIERKSRELRLIFRKSIFEIENGIFRINRNETNMRLDYNLTNMKSDLLEYLEIDGDSLIELDIANAQFAFLSYIVENLDTDFIHKSQNGNLYNNDKKEWFRIAFDKINKGQDNFRKIYPKTMKFIDEFKKEYGYKSFSNLLQRLESSVMIDGLMNKLMDKFQVFPIHDAIRVKESEVDLVKKEIELYFKEIDFKCLLRIKSKKEVEIINYKGIKQVEIEKVTKEDKKLFIEKINALYNIGLEPSEKLICDFNIWNNEKSWYLYYKWRKSNPYKNIS
jgi:hypothetical protein